MCADADARDVLRNRSQALNPLHWPDTEDGATNEHGDDDRDAAPDERRPRDRAHLFELTHIAAHHESLRADLARWEKVSRSTDLD